MGALNAVALNPTSTVESNSARSSPPAAGGTSNTANPVLEDLVEIANVPSLDQIASLQTSNPTEFQSVLSDAIRQLRQAESQTTDPAALAFLTSLADRFQQLQEVGAPGLSFSGTTTG
jgi:hypothetical protein